MSSDETAANLRRAFREPGCPLCRRVQEHEARYLQNLLLEYVDDIPTQVGLQRSLGLCREHAWALQCTALTLMGSGGVSTAILYVGVSRHILDALSGYLAQPSASRRGDHLGLRLRRWLQQRGQWGSRLAVHLATPGRNLFARMLPVAACPTCEQIEIVEHGDLAVLVRQLADADFRAAYAASDGLCLPHVRQALLLAGDGDAVRALGEVAAAQLRLLLHDLEEYWRKYDWNYRAETRHPWEQAARVRAIAFFSGEAREQQTEAAVAQRRWARTEYHKRLAGQASALESTA